MAQSYKTTKDGFPDLMLKKDGALRFVEVKASGDIIRGNQLTRIKQLRAAGFQTDIARIDWIIDPNQIYVVQDILGCRFAATENIMRVPNRFFA